MFGFPAIHELGQRLGPKPGSGRLGQPARQAPTAAFGSRSHRIAQIGVERDTELVDFHPGIIPRYDAPRYEATRSLPGKVRGRWVLSIRSIELGYRDY